jgi:hypothetical protein
MIWLQIRLQTLKLPVTLWEKLDSKMNFYKKIRTPKDTYLGQKASFKPSCVPNGGAVWSVEQQEKSQINDVYKLTKVMSVYFAILSGLPQPANSNHLAQAVGDLTNGINCEKFYFD